MENLEKYLKYYFLEDYLFNEVHKNFKKNGRLKPEEFFAIIIWKSNRSKTIVLKSIKESGKTAQKITSEIFKAEKPEDKLKTLVEIKGIGIKMASAILTVLYPNDFTVLDYRALASLKKINEKIEGNASSKIYPYKAYFDYLERCKKLAAKFNLSLRNFDRALFGMDFYVGEGGLKDLSIS